MKLIQLRYFVEVCRWGNNTTKAAEKFHISQPTISNAIKELENEFGVLLFRRANGRLHITLEGERFLKEAHELLCKADELELTMRGVGIERKKIILGVTPMIGAFLFPNLCSRFIQQHPDIEFEILEQGASATHELLAKKKIDVELNINYMADSTQFRHRPLKRSQYCLCIHRDHPLAYAPSVTMKDFSKVGLLLLSGTTYHAEMILKLFTNQGIQPQILARSNQLQTLIQMVRNGSGASIFLQEVENIYPDIVAIPFQDPLPAEIGMFWNKESTAYCRVNEFLKFITKEF